MPPPPLPQPTKNDLPVTDPNTALLLQMSNSLHAIQARVEAAENMDTWRPLTTYEDRPGPFTQQVRGVIRSNISKPLKIDYTGTGDPYQHLQAFRSLTSAKGYTDEVCCNMFQETLSGEALSWFYELPAGSIGNFKELADKFLARFILRTDRIHTPKGLLKVQQGENETLKSFVNRWQAATAKCRDLNKELAELAFRRGLRVGEFLYGINHHPPASYDELMATAIRHAQAEFETYVDNIRPERRTSNLAPVAREEPRKREWVHDQGRSPHNSSKRSKDSSSRSGGYVTTQSHREERAQQAPRTPPPPRYEVFTILNASYETIWNENKDEIPGPPPRKFPKSKFTQQDTRRFCTYHEDAGHNTNLCMALKNTIESLIQQCKLQRYLPAKEIGAIDVYGRILMIHGGGPKNLPPRQKKRNSSFGHPEVFNFHKAPQQGGDIEWKSVTFLQEEETDLRMPHDDPFLITLQMDHYIIYRVLVDIGASVSVLFRYAYKALNRGRAKLSQDNEPLISFQEI
ncbi:uncharacterized protein LOC133722871 [Rosa rugosa]|uniref:uncharacterized protein LOC133722871 n=1 Tax=Rosa rugosa TaxID=74645 RepID=UPI002B40D5B3|nr:uncharacterized protein LOC133722871 [Rosa rugosa]